MPLAFPPPLSPGDLVAVVAPSSPFDPFELWRGLAWVRGRYRVRARSGILERRGYLAGSDSRRASELRAAMIDPEVKAILGARGGYGAMRVVRDLPWDAFARSPKWIVGFSDMTALHLEANARGVATIHGPNVTGLGRASPIVRLSAIEALERPASRRTWSGLRVLRAGSAEGVAFGGNLALVHAMSAAGHVRVPDGAVLCLEDVTERPYRIDRMLTALAMSELVRPISAIVFGAFTDCEPGRDGRTYEEVLASFAEAMGVPVVSGAPFGHGDHNEAFVLGATARVDGDRVVVGR